MGRKGFVHILLAVLVVAIIGAATGYFILNKTQSPSGQQCTMEAKLCPDGSAVGRTGPNCEFTACPEVSPTTSASPSTSSGQSAVPTDWKTYRNEQYGFEFKYPSVSDKSFSVDETKDLVSSPQWWKVYKLSSDALMTLEVDRKPCNDTLAYDPIEKWTWSYGDELKTITTNGYKLRSFVAGCYECYEDTTGESDRINIATFVCNDKKTACFSIDSARVNNAQRSNMEDVFMHQVLPAFKIDRTVFEKIGCFDDGSKG